ncbi:MAG: Flp pilus assembly protein CpaB [Alphaproteobacteria bacterium]|nr:Flp pilus assembly protein CpaB [Alphaproteobacteria bacterium]
MFATLPPRRLLLLATAMLLSLVTALVVRAWVQHVRSEAAAPVVTQAAPPTPKMVLVAAKALPAGHFLHTEDLAWQSWPNNDLSKSYMAKGTVNLDAIVGSVVKSGIAQGEPITDLRIVKKGDRGFLAAIVTPGYRAITVSLQAGAGLSGLAVPGDHVDLILAMDVPSTNKNAPARRMSETVLQDIRVLAVDQKINDQAHDAPLARTATLEVTPKQAEVVTLLTEMGKLSMTLRSVGSAENDALPHQPTLTWDTDAVNMPFLHHGSGGTPAAANRVDVVRGTSKSSIEFRGGRAIESAAVPPAPQSSGAAAVGAATAKALGAAGRAVGQ